MFEPYSKENLNHRPLRVYQETLATANMCEVARLFCEHSVRNMNKDTASSVSCWSLMAGVFLIQIRMLRFCRLQVVLNELG